jgi:hypothetical protein
VLKFPFIEVTPTRLVKVTAKNIEAGNELRMNPIGTDDFWEDLLDFIEQGKVIPVIGEHAVTFGEGNEPLCPWLASELANRLGVTCTRLSATPTLNDVVREHLLAGGERNAIYTRLSRILRERCPVPGSVLRDLAGIAAFNLYLTTTFDPLLERALNAVRFGGAETTRTQAFFPGAANKDLPARRAELAGVTVYHVLGKVSVPPVSSSRGRKTYGIFFANCRGTFRPT